MDEKQQFWIADKLWLQTRSGFLLYHMVAQGNALKTYTVEGRYIPMQGGWRANPKFKPKGSP